MRRTLAVLASFAAIVSATPLLNSRQSEGTLDPAAALAAALLPPGTKSFKIEDIEPEIPVPNAKRKFLWYGPFKIKAANSTENPGNGQSLDPSGTAYNYVIDDMLKDVTLLTGNLTTFNEDGTRAGVNNGLYTHHVAVTDATKPFPAVASCSNGDGPAAIQVSSVFAGLEGKARTFFTLPDGTLDAGYYVGPDNKLILGVDLVNYVNAPRMVSVRVDVTYLEKKVPNYMDTSFQIVSLGFCNGSGLDVHPPHGISKFSMKSDITINEDGTMFELTGHLHDGGVNMVGKINGNEVCDSKAIYGGDSTFMSGMGNLSNWQTINEMTTCMPAFNVSKGDKLSIEAFYDLDKHPPRPRVEGGMAEEMAIMAFYFAK